MNAKMTVRKRYCGVMRAILASAALSLFGTAHADALYWYTSYDSAVSQAKQLGRLIFFIGGRTSCGLTQGTIANCEDASVKPTLAKNYVLWFCNYDTQRTYFNRYASGLTGGAFPLTCVIDPNKPTTFMARTTGPLEPDEILALLKKAGSSSGSSSKSVLVTFNANGGDLSASRKVKVGNAVGSLPKCTRKGYTLKGWYTKKSGGTPITTATKVKAKVTYYAQWTPIKYKIAFNANGGKGTAMKTIVATYGKAVKLPANTYKRTNYKFLGWAKKKTDTTAKYTNKASVKNLSSVKGKTITLYAVWKRTK